MKFQISIDHHGDELREGNIGFPAKSFNGFCRVAKKEIDLGGAVEFRINDNEFLPIEPDMVEGDLYEFANGVGFAGADDIVIRGVLLKHEPHGADIIASEAPVPAGIEVTEAKFGLESELDLCDSIGDFASDELKSPAGRFMVEEDAGAGEEIVAFAVVDGDVVAIDFGDAIGRAGIEGSVFALRDLEHLAVHFAAGGLVEPGLGAGLPESLEHACDAYGGEFRGEDGLLPGCWNEGHGGEVINLVRLNIGENLCQGGLIEKVCLVDFDFFANMLDALLGFGAGTANDTGDAIAL